MGGNTWMDEWIWGETHGWMSGYGGEHMDG